MDISKKLAIVTSATMACFGLVGCGTQSNAKSTPNQSKIVKTASKKPIANSQLAKLNYRPGQSGIVKLNHNHSTLHAGQWKSNHVYYHKLDNEKRTGDNVGMIEKRNVTNDKLRVRQTVNPVGWHQRFVNGQPTLNRGHEIAYSMSKGIARNGDYNPKAVAGDQNNPKNLFTQTAFSNQKLQTIYESYVRNALKRNEKVVYSVQPVFQGQDKMAKGVHMMALSTNHKLNFNVYLYNVQPGVKYNYATGTSKNDRKMKVPTPKNAPKFNNDNKGNRRNWKRGYRRGYRRGKWHYSRYHRNWHYRRNHRMNWHKHSYRGYHAHEGKSVRNGKRMYHSKNEGRWGKRWDKEEYKYNHPKKVNPYKHDPLLN